MIVPSRILAIARNDFELLRQDLTAPVILLVMPLVVAAFVEPAVTPILRHEGWPHVGGAAQAVPGMALLFSFYMVAFAGTNFYREFIWTTWDRLRSLPLTRAELMIGKLAPAFVLLAVQQAILLGAGFVFFNLRLHGSAAGLVLISVAFIIFLTTFIFVTVALCRTLQQLLAVTNLSAILFAAIGGALTPVKTLPSWAAVVAPISPIYWAMKGFNRMLVDGQGVKGAVTPAAVLLAGAACLAVVGIRTFRFDARKSGTL